MGLFFGPLGGIGLHVRIWDLLSLCSHALFKSILWSRTRGTVLMSVSKGEKLESLGESSVSLSSFPVHSGTSIRYLALKTRSPSIL